MKPKQHEAHLLELELDELLELEVDVEPIVGTAATPHDSRRSKGSGFIWAVAQN